MQYNTSMDTTTEKYRYNAKGQIASISEYNYTTAGGSIETERTTLTYDAKGNVSSEQSSGGTVTYTYYDNLKTPFNIMSPYQPGNPYLVKTASEAGVVLNYTYQFDTKNRLIKEEAKDAAGTVVMMKLYGW